jgi:fluoride exporter
MGRTAPVTKPDPKLPLDPHVVSATNSANKPRPAHLSWANIGLVAAGGGPGTGLRYLITMVVPAWAGVPVATFGINVVGALLLGLLLERLARQGLDIGWNRRVRLGVGTGALGGFTTYSALAVETATLAATHPGRAIAYGLGTVIVGGMASVAGIWLSRGHQRPGIVEPNKES